MAKAAMHLNIGLHRHSIVNTFRAMVKLVQDKANK